MLPFLLLAPWPCTASPRGQEVAERAVDAESGHTYFRTPVPLTVQDARLLARAVGGTLACVETAGEETFLLDNFGAAEGYWIGLEFPRERWDSGAAIGTSHWAAGEPGGGPAEPFTLWNWGEPGGWGDVAGDVSVELYRALIELPSGTELDALPDVPVVRAQNRGVLLCLIQGLEARDLEAARHPNLNRLWKSSVWTFDAGSDPSGDPLAGLGMIAWGVGSAKSRLTSAAPRNAPVPGVENLLTRLERSHPGIQTAALLDDPALTGILVDGRVDLRASSASVLRGGAAGPVEQALRLATPLCILRAWTDLRPPGSDAPKESERARAIAAIDAELGSLLAGLRARPAFAEEDWWIALAGVAPPAEKGKGSRPDLRAESGTPLLIAAPELRPREILDEVSLADLHASAAERLGVEPRPAWMLDGRALVPDAPAVYGENLIVNGSAELSLFSTSSDAPLVAGWRQLRPFRIGAWGAGDVGPPERGARHFQGGSGVASRMEQAIDLGAHAAEVDAGSVRYRLSGWLGARRRTQATIELGLELLGEQGRVLARATLGPAERADRSGASGAEADLAEGLVEFQTGGKVPRRTRAARIVLRAEGASGAGQTLADELSLVLERD